MPPLNGQPNPCAHGAGILIPTGTAISCSQTQKTGNTGKKCFSSALLLTPLRCSAHTSPGPQQHCPDVPAHSPSDSPASHHHIPHVSDCNHNIPPVSDFNKTLGAAISPLYFPPHKQSKLGNFPARQACWAAEGAQIKCWKSEGKTWADQHLK